LSPPPCRLLRRWRQKVFRSSEKSALRGVGVVAGRRDGGNGLGNAPSKQTHTPNLKSLQLLPAISKAANSSGSSNPSPWRPGLTWCALAECCTSIACKGKGADKMRRLVHLCRVDRTREALPKPPQSSPHLDGLSFLLPREEGRSTWTSTPGLRPEITAGRAEALPADCASASVALVASATSATSTSRTVVRRGMV
jgi:hypothetical protein